MTGGRPRWQPSALCSSGGRTAQEEPRRARRPLERPAPQDRHLRLARVRRRSPSSSAARSAPRTLTDDDTGNGVLARRRPGDRRRRLPRQGRRAGARPARDGAAPSTTRSFKAAVTDVVARLQAARAHVIDVESPFAKGNEGQISKDGRSALVTFSIPGDETSPRSASTRRSTRPPRAQARIPTCASSSSATPVADKALDESLDDDFQRAETLSLPITLLILIVAFGALVAAGVPLLLAITAVDRRRSAWSARSARSFPMDESDRTR